MTILYLEESPLNNVNSIATKYTLEKYVDECLTLIDAAELHNRLVSDCTQSVNLLSIESMAKNFHSGLFAALGNQNVR